MKTHRFQNIKHQDNKRKMSMYTYQVFPFMIDPCHVLLFPFLQVKYIHAICPRTRIWVKVPHNKRILEIQRNSEDLENELPFPNHIT